MEFQTVTSDNYLIESKSTGLEILNVEPGVLSNQTTGVTPNYWEKNTAANYTIGFVPKNYEQAMKILITVPKEIQIPENFTCRGLSGTDKEFVNCTKFDENTIIV